jgi:DNA-binding winged helix-turn-helix (wHTH) protein
VTIHFGAFVLDLDSRQLIQAGREIHLTPKAFELLAILVRERPKALSKAVLLERLWPDTFVAEANVANLVAEVRHALGDNAESPAYIRTARRYGYAFSAEVTIRPDASVPSRDGATCWLEWGRRKFPLSAGENVVGRDADVAVRLDTSTVSRRHARLVVTANGTMLEDFDSKNGTFVGTERITAPVALADGDAISIGSVLLTFHVRPSSASTETEGPRR